jgi:hypothetical protein
MADPAAPLDEFPALYEKCFDYSIPSGWQALMRELSRELSADPSVRIVQAKTKWGSLTVYIENDDPDHMYKGGTALLLKKYERRAEYTCVSCGAETQERRPSNLCVDCAAVEVLAR